MNSNCNKVLNKEVLSGRNAKQLNILKHWTQYLCKHKIFLVVISVLLKKTHPKFEALKPRKNFNICLLKTPNL